MTNTKTQLTARYDAAIAQLSEQMIGDALTRARTIITDRVDVQPLDLRAKAKAKKKYKRPSGEVAHLAGKRGKTLCGVKKMKDALVRPLDKFASEEHACGRCKRIVADRKP